jgi:hypothetical protein
MAVCKQLSGKYVEMWDPFTEGLSEDRKRISRGDMFLRSLRLRSWWIARHEADGFTIYIVTRGPLCQTDSWFKLNSHAP